MELSLLILVCIHKLYIVYLEIYVVPIGHGFSFFGHGKSMLTKRGAPCYSQHGVFASPLSAFFNCCCVHT